MQDAINWKIVCGTAVLDVVADQLNIEFSAELDLLQGAVRATVYVEQPG